jgi:hypothetical protein
MTEMSKVVDLRTRPGYQPDFAALARRRVAAARSALNLSASEFASLLTPLVGWPVSGETVEAWAIDSVPPGDVLVAADTVSQAGSREELTGSLLGKVPNSFTADALEGAWVTCFQFHRGDSLRIHADIVTVAAESDRLVRARNFPPTPRSEGRASPFRNDHWKNSNDTRYFGSLHLAVLPGETVMEGHYTGFASDIQVSFGPWRWARLDPDSLIDADLDKVRLREPAEVYDLVMNQSQTDAPLILGAVREDA